jgi:hypothetical protein
VTDVGSTKEIHGRPPVTEPRAYLETTWSLFPPTRARTGFMTKTMSEKRYGDDSACYSRRLRAVDVHHVGDDTEGPRAAFVRALRQGGHDE